MLESLGSSHKLGECANRVRVDQCISAIRAVEVPVKFRLHSSCNHVTEVAKALRFVSSR
jgi:hypothetical protein